MSNRHTEEHCPCGHRLRTVVELDTGLCVRCLERGESEEPVEIPAGESFAYEPERGSK